MPRNFARGEPPPSNSHEWVGLGTPPTPAQVINARKVEAQRAALPPPQLFVRSNSLTMVEVRPKRRVWPWALATGIAGFLWGRAGRY